LPHLGDDLLRGCLVLSHRDTGHGDEESQRHHCEDDSVAVHTLSPRGSVPRTATAVRSVHLASKLSLLLVVELNVVKLRPLVIGALKFERHRLSVFGYLARDVDDGLPCLLLDRLGGVSIHTGHRDRVEAGTKTGGWIIFAVDFGSDPKMNGFAFRTYPVGRQLEIIAGHFVPAGLTLRCGSRIELRLCKVKLPRAVDRIGVLRRKACGKHCCNDGSKSDRASETIHGGLLFRGCSWLEVVAAETTIISPSRTDRIKDFPATAVQHSASSARPAPIPDRAETIGAAGPAAPIASA